jgi:long-subunit fatty acid transport protein
MAKKSLTINQNQKMKRKLLIALSSVLLSTGLMAGGIMTNTNHSAAYARMLARNACLGIDAVYYNPAGLTKLSNGFYLSLNNQSIFQTKDVVNDYPYLHGSPDAKFTGVVKAPVFPGVYAVYKMNKLAFSFGFNPVGGGGGATYDTGLPSFEIPISDLVPMLGSSGFGVTDYKADINFEGTSVYFGYQFGVSYEINPSISLFAGLRAVTAKNTYNGSIKDIMVNPTYTAPPIPGLTAPSFAGSFMRADALGIQMNSYFTDGATYYTGVATQYNTAAAGAGQLAAAGLGSYTFAEAQAAGAITPEEQAQFEGALTAVGQPASTPIGTAEVVYTTTAGQATAGAAQLSGGADQMAVLAASTGDMNVDVVQTGTGYTPIFGANLTIAEKLTIALKYEMKTKIELTNETKVDETGMFPDGAKTRADMPAMLSVGASYPVTEKLRASLGYNYYWDKTADYGKSDESGNPIANDMVIDKNYFELAVGLEYNFTDKFLLSAGYLSSQTGVSKNYQTDLSYSLSSNTVAFGGKYMITPTIGLNLGGLYTMYGEDSKTYSHMLETTSIPVNENYAKTNWLLAVGLDFKIGK